MNGTDTWKRNLKMFADLEAKNAANNPEACAKVLVQLVTSLGPDFVAALKSALGSSEPSMAAFRFGAPTHSPTGAPLLKGHEREEIDKSMGMGNRTPKRSGVQADGTFVIHTMRPSDVRKMIAKGG